jgi:hypothetical protein
VQAIKYLVDPTDWFVCGKNLRVPAPETKANAFRLWFDVHQENFGKASYTFGIIQRDARKYLAIMEEHDCTILEAQQLSE